MELEKVFLATIKINLKQIKNGNSAEIKEEILNNTNFNIFRKEFSFELSNELRQKYGGFSFKKKILHEKIYLKEKQMTFYEEPTQEKITSSQNFKIKYFIVIFSCYYLGHHLKKAASGEMGNEKRTVLNGKEELLQR